MVLSLETDLPVLFESRCIFIVYACVHECECVLECVYHDLHYDSGSLSCRWD